jgi:hypothetical protein
MKLNRWMLALLCCCVLVMPVLAQNQTLGLGEMVEGRTEDRNVSYDLEVREGAFYLVRLTSKDFDTYLSVFDEDNNVIAENDDSGSTEISQVYFIADSTMTVRVEVDAFSSRNANGDYVLLAERIEVTPISIDESVTVSANSSVERFFEFEGTAGDFLDISFVSSDNTDTTLTLFFNQQQIDYDDDGGQNSNPLLRGVLLSNTGTFILRLSGFSNRNIGSGELRVVPARTQILSVSEPLSLSYTESYVQEVVFMDVTANTTYKLEAFSDLSAYLTISMISEESGTIGSVSFSGGTGGSIQFVPTRSERLRLDVTISTTGENEVLLRLFEGE